MTNESEMNLFDRWSETRDRAEYIKLTMQLFPEVDEKKANEMADELEYRVA